MPKKVFITDSLKNSAILLLTIIFIWFWVNNVVLAAYCLQLTAILVIFYFSGRMFLSKTNQKDHEYVLDTTIFTSALLLILSATGGLSSPLFFLTYFLFFAVAMLFDTIVTLILTLALTLFFASTLNSLDSAMQMISILIFSPLAIYFGRQYLRLLETQDKVKILHKETRQLSTITYHQSTNLANEETNALLFLTLNFKNSLLKILHYTSDLMTDIGHLNLMQKEQLEKIHQTAKELLKSGEKLKERIDKETD